MKKPRKDKLRKRIAAVVFVVTMYALLMIADANMQTISFGTCIVLVVVLMPVLLASAVIAGGVRW